MNKRRTKSKYKRLGIVLSERDIKLLGLYAREHHTSSTMALRHIVKEVLHAYTPASTPPVDERQLGLFDTLQIDIFNNTTKV